MPRRGTWAPREALSGLRTGRQVAGRSTLEEAESSREDEAPSKGGVDGGRRETGGSGRNAERVPGAGNPMSLQVVRLQDFAEHRTFTRGSAGRGNPACAAAGGP